MTKVVSYTALHYGLDYLEYAIRSVIDHVDQHYILYSPTGSHGSLTNEPCPDSRDDLYAAAVRGAGDKLVWIDGSWDYEGQQRDSIYQYAPDADVILVVDADEVWGEGLAEQAIYFAQTGTRYMRLRMVHFWRSFYQAIPYDPAYPIRVIAPKRPEGDRTFTSGRVAMGEPLSRYPENGYWISHFGYAQRPEIVRYKLLTHGHRNELRTDIDWFAERYMNMRACADLHPVGSEYWNTEDVNPFDYMPEFMKEHPYARRAIIE